MKENKTLTGISQQLTGPIMVSYVWWILHEACARNIHRLYFLARDGYLLYEIAKRFCLKFGLNIECKYLYCSRASLRMPSYHLIGEEAYDLLTLQGYHVTPLSLMQRADLNTDEMKSVYNDIGFSSDHEKEILTNSELREFAQKLRTSECFRSLVEHKSKLAYPNAIEYFRQEGLLEDQTVAIVDSGWTGSIQRSLRQLLNSTGKKIQLVGFYFGMYSEPKDSKDGTFLTWYFDKYSKKLNKILFCNNVFECMLSAPHGMTLGYENVGSKFQPILKPYFSKTIIDKVNEQTDSVLDYTNNVLPKINFEAFNYEFEYKKTQKLLRRFMVKPSRKEVEILGSFSFCDDVTEGYQFFLATPEQREALNGYLLFSRIFRRIFGIEVKKHTHELFWIYGNIALLPSYVRLWYRLNVYIWEWLRYTLK